MRSRIRFRVERNGVKEERYAPGKILRIEKRGTSPAEVLTKPILFPKIFQLRTVWKIYKKSKKLDDTNVKKEIIFLLVFSNIKSVGTISTGNK
ncbi:MAG: hypothetical protein B2I18_03920 [Cuniculiplasma sp. C_DKE]|nr:MAG: hypothetical protein B2I18_03920 [Cuniculiplasma sp. C_DKE]